MEYLWYHCLVMLRRNVFTHHHLISFSHFFLFEAVYLLLNRLINYSKEIDAKKTCSDASAFDELI